MLGRVSKRAFLNRFGVWFDTSLSNVEKTLAQKGQNYTAVEIFSRSKFLTSHSMLRRLSKRLDKPAEYVCPGQVKASENSLLLFFSKSTGKYLPRIRAGDFFYIPLVMTLGATWVPVWATAVFAFFYIPFAVSASRIFVTRMDLLPHMECVLMQKVGYFGLARTELVQIRNLQRIKPENSIYNYYHTWLGGYNPHVMFRDAETKQEYAFDVNGTWVEENLKHPLIV